MGVSGKSHASAALPPSKIPDIHSTGGWTNLQGRSGRVRKISPARTEIRCPGRPARSQSLQRLHCLGQHKTSCRLPLKCDSTRAKNKIFVFRRNGRVHLNRRGRQFSRLLAAEVCGSEVVVLDTPCSVVV
jgi:hypothetical protein